MVELSSLLVQAPSRQQTLVEVKQLEWMSPRCKMEVEVRVDHRKLMVVEYTEDCLVLMA